MEQRGFNWNWSAEDDEDSDGVEFVPSDDAPLKDSKQKDAGSAAQYLQSLINETQSSGKKKKKKSKK